MSETNRTKDPMSHSHLEPKIKEVVDPVMDSAEALMLPMLRSLAKDLVKAKGWKEDDAKIDKLILVGITERILERLAIRVPDSINEMIDAFSTFQMCEKFGNLPAILDKLKSGTPEEQREAMKDGLRIAKAMLDDIDLNDNEKKTEPRRSPMEIIRELQNHPDVKIMEMTPGGKSGTVGISIDDLLRNVSTGPTKES